MTDIFEELSIVGDPIKEEDRVIHLLACIPPSFDVLVTALEASEDVSKMEIVTDRLLCEEIKLKEKVACGGKAHEMRARQRPTENHHSIISHS